MDRAAKVTVVLPVRDGQDRIADEVVRVLEEITELVSGSVEMIVVDDGSRDATPEVLDRLCDQNRQIRVARHGRPLGMEAAGQTGLERATGTLVFIQESDTPLRMDDLRHLYEMARDVTVVAARARSGAMPSRQPLLRRLRAWGVRTTGIPQDVEEELSPFARPVPGLQMVRRAHLQRLGSRWGESTRLRADRVVAGR